MRICEDVDDRHTGQSSLTACQPYVCSAWAASLRLDLTATIRNKETALKPRLTLLLCMIVLLSVLAPISASARRQRPHAITPHGDNGKELAVYVNRLGLNAMDVIGWATLNGAQMMRKDDEFGTIAPGKLADLLVVDGDPLSNIELLGDPSNLSVVMQSGRFVTNRLTPAAETRSGRQTS